MLLLKQVDFARQAALLFLIFSENADAGQCFLLKTNQIVLSGLLVVMAFYMCHHEDSHALLDQLLFVEVSSLLNSFVLYALFLFLEKALVESIDPARDKSFA